MILLKNYFFANILLPMLTAYICMMINTLYAKDSRDPKLHQEDWKGNVTNFMLLWAIITVFMQLYKAYLKYKWGI